MVIAPQASKIILAFVMLFVCLSGCAHREARQPIPQGTIKRYADDICEVRTRTGDNIFVAMKDGVMTGDIAHTFSHENFPLPAGSATLNHDDMNFAPMSFVPPSNVEFLGKPVDDDKRQSNTLLATEAYENCNRTAISPEKFINNGRAFYVSRSSRN